MDEDVYFFPVVVYRALMDCQARGVCTETILLDCAQHFWYNCGVEYYGSAYVRKRARGA